MVIKYATNWKQIQKILNVPEEMIIVAYHWHNGELVKIGFKIK